MDKHVFTLYQESMANTSLYLLIILVALAQVISSQPKIRIDCEPCSLKLQHFNVYCPTYGSCQWICQEKLADCNTGTRYHCARSFHDKDRFIDACIPEVFCTEGEEPRLSINRTSSHVEQAIVPIHCRPCFKWDRFNDRLNTSSATYSECPSLKTNLCTEQQHKVDCGNVSHRELTKTDGHCRCDARKGYAAQSEEMCFYENKKCFKKKCPDGEELLLNYNCAKECPAGLARQKTSDSCQHVIILPPATTPVYTTAGKDNAQHLSTGKCLHPIFVRLRQQVKQLTKEEIGLKIMEADEEAPKESNQDIRSEEQMSLVEAARHSESDVDTGRTLTNTPKTKTLQAVSPVEREGATRSTVTTIAETHDDQGSVSLDKDTTDGKTNVSTKKTGENPAAERTGSASPKKDTSDGQPKASTENIGENPAEERTGSAPLGKDATDGKPKASTAETGECLVKKTSSGQEARKIWFEPAQKTDSGHATFDATDWKPKASTAKTGECLEKKTSSGQHARTDLEWQKQTLAFRSATLGKDPTDRKPKASAEKTGECLVKATSSGSELLGTHTTDWKPKKAGENRVKKLTSDSDRAGGSHETVIASATMHNSSHDIEKEIQERVFQILLTLKSTDVVQRNACLQIMNEEPATNFDLLKEFRLHLPQSDFCTRFNIPTMPMYNAYKPSGDKTLCMYKMFSLLIFGHPFNHISLRIAAARFALDNFDNYVQQLTDEFKKKSWLNGGAYAEPFFKMHGLEFKWRYYGVLFNEVADAFVDVVRGLVTEGNGHGPFYLQILGDSLNLNIVQFFEESRYNDQDVTNVPGLNVSLKSSASKNRELSVYWMKSSGKCQYKYNLFPLFTNVTEIESPVNTSAQQETPV